MKPDFRIYKQETTEHWSEDIRSRAARLFGVYLFDVNRHVHCCELTPSFEMNYLGPTWTGSIEDDEARQSLFEDILEGDAETDLVRYVHVGSVKVDECEEIGTSDESWARFLEEAGGDEEEAYNLALDKWSEYCRGNGWVC